MRILLFTLLLVCQIANAQVKVTSSKPINIANGLMVDEPTVIGYNNGLYYLYNGRTGALSAFKKDLSIAAEYKLDIAEKGEYAASIQVNDKMYILIAVKAEEKGKLVAYEVTTEGQTKEVAELTSALSEIKTEAKPKFNLLKMGGKLAVTQSDDNSKIGVYYTDYSPKKENVKVTVIMLDNNFNKLWSKKATLPFEYERKDDYIKFAVDNKGNACAAIPNAQGEQKQSCYLHTFNSAGTMQKGSYPVSTSKITYSLVLQPDNKGNFYVATDYHTPFKEGTSGIKLMMYNCDSTKATWVKDYNHSKMFTSDDRKKAISAMNFYVTSVNISENGTLFVTQEQRMPGNGNYGVLFCSYSADGNLLNSAFSPKVNTGMMNDWTPVLVKDNKLHAIYYYGGDNDFVVNVDKEYGFYTLAYDGNKLEKAFVPNTRVGGGLMKATIHGNRMLLFFITDIRTGFLHLVEF